MNYATVTKTKSMVFERFKVLINTVKVKIVPLFELELSIDPCAVKVLNRAVDLWDLWSLLLYCQPSWTNK